MNKIEFESIGGPGNCEKHGSFTHRILNAPFPGFAPIVLGCGECAAEADRIETESKAAEERARLLVRSRIPEDYIGRTIDSYPALTADQKKATEGCRWYVRNYERLRLTAERGSWVVFVGNPGTGKTGMACAIAQALIETGRSSIYHTLASLKRHIWDAKSRGSSESQAVDELAKCELLIIDEIGATVGGDGERSTLVDVLNERYANKRPLLMISNLTLDQFKAGVDPRILDRCEQRAAYSLCAWQSLRTPRQLRAA